MVHPLYPHRNRCRDRRYPLRRQVLVGTMYSDINRVDEAIDDAEVALKRARRYVRKLEVAQKEDWKESVTDARAGASWQLGQATGDCVKAVHALEGKET